MALQRASREILRFRCSSSFPGPFFKTSSSPSFCHLYFRNPRHRCHYPMCVIDFRRWNHGGIRTLCSACSRVVGIVRSPDLVDLEYADLNLSRKVSAEVGHIRIRQHVNPLSSAFSVPSEVPEWNLVFNDPTLPLVVDIGCGSGRFILWLAKRHSSLKNYLGLEIRQKLVKRANFWVKELALHNTYFLFANATVSLQQLLSSYPGPLVSVFILCPDPHFKRRHKKRRVVQEPVVYTIVNYLTTGGQVFVQSDVLEVALDMRNQFDALSDLQHMDAVDCSTSYNCDEDGWLLRNPLGIRTEREIHAELEGAKIYRRMYQKAPR
ncbi:hypothetical protein Nepgr_019296 [Nepenthes gracilis]|uniref:tRNA (guanine(46)-N(7))-methyltransferase n=1 Tax=Nepenthes gracilis TaxID=150966 RepID=A0AAD3SUW7_NEPGR|nr:hypothetical protein Nepgr_019296 [Nepenthes gracilis]